jgi:hypothetical protein
LFDFEQNDVADRHFKLCLEYTHVDSIELWPCAHMMHPHVLKDTDSDSGWISVKNYSLHESVDRGEGMLTVDRGEGMLTVAVSVENPRLPIGLPT